ncbi:MAG: LptE family protein, partial [Candidatus Bathyarchaeia archaeon]
MRGCRNSLLLSACLIFQACGYSFVGMGSGLPPDIKKVAIPIFTNQTAETRIENIMTDLLIREFNRSKRLQVVTEKDADAIILGTVKAITISPISYSPARVVVENRITLYIDVVMKRRGEEEILWKDPNLSGYYDYQVVSDIPVSERNKEEAILKAAEVLSQRIH